jgi:3-oxoacyl-[acyl-carrier-protein] synthase-3
MDLAAVHPTHRLAVVATGRALPARVWTNHDLIAARHLDSTPEWIESRTGIAQRYLVGEGESTFTLARDAARAALAKAGVAPSSVGVVIVATCTPDLTFPSVAALVQADLGVGTQAVVLDVNAACSGFVHALAVADGLMAAQTADYALVIGAETFSNVVDWSDRATCVLFGDGAGAVLLRKVPVADGRGLLAYELGADGHFAPELCASHGVARGRQAGVVQMNGREVFRQAVRQMGDLAQAQALLAQVGAQMDDVDWVVPHQANVRILDAAATELGVPRGKVVVTVDRHANTSAASIPLALDVAVEEGKIQTGQLLLLQAFGAGFVWSSAVLRW